VDTHADTHVAAAVDRNGGVLGIESFLTNEAGYESPDVVVDVATDYSLGGLTLLGVNPDGGFVLVLDEVDTDDSGAIRVEETVHLFDVGGVHLGEARFPLESQFVEVGHALAVGPDGYAYGLLTRPDHVEVARLTYAK
jgi:hypothetical protein